MTKENPFFTMPPAEEDKGEKALEAAAAAAAAAAKVTRVGVATTVQLPSASRAPGGSKNEPSDDLTTIDVILHKLRLHDGRNLACYTFEMVKSPPYEEGTGGNATDYDDDFTRVGVDVDVDVSPSATAATATVTPQKLLPSSSGRGAAQHPHPHPHPVLYLHGFPSSGWEGAFCASQVHEAGGELFAVDRPGFGSSDPMPCMPHVRSPLRKERARSGAADKEEEGEEEDEDDRRLEQVTHDLWELVAAQNWDDFSVVGVSGGGLFALAMLSSYLSGATSNDDDDQGTPDPTSRQQKQQKQKQQQHSFQPLTARPYPLLRSVCIVAGVCCAAGGEDDMMASNRGMCRVVNAIRPTNGQVTGNPTGWWSRLRFHALFQTLGWLMGALPRWMLLKLQLREDFPPADQEILQGSHIGRHLIASVQHSLSKRGACRAMKDEACILFRCKPLRFHETLRAQMNDLQLRRGDGGNDPHDQAVPQIAIFQGREDKNVPMRHSQYVHEHLLRGRGALRLYEDLGHMSLLHAAADEIARFAVSPS
jgi:pimeloyl-ACP methyl ester carboxylesterase